MQLGREWLSGAMALGWAAVGAIACAAMIPLEPNLLEEGFALHVAQRIVAGDRLYRDIVFYSGPLPFELLALLFRLFGDEIAVARGAVVALHGVATGLLYALARRAGAGPLAHGAGAVLATAPVLLFPLFSIYFHTTIAFYLIVIALYAGLRGLASTSWAVAAGVLVAFVALSKQSLGVVLALGLLLAIGFVSPRGKGARRVLAMTAAGATVAVITCVVFAVRGDLGPFVRSMVVLPLSLGTSFHASYINFWPPGRLAGDAWINAPFYIPKIFHLLTVAPTLQHRSPPPGESWWGTPVILLTQLLFALPWIALAATVVRQFRGKALTPPAWITTAGLVVLLSNLFPRADWGHLVFVLPLAAAQLCVLAGTRRVERKRPHWRTGGWAAALAVVLIAGAGTVGLRFHALARTPLLGPRVPLRHLGPEARWVANAVHHLREHALPGEAIFVARAEPLIYFATETRNPTPFEGVVTGFREEQEEMILRGLEQVRYVVMSDVDQPLMTFYGEELPRVQAYLERYFHRPDAWRGAYSPTQVLERGPDRGAALRDFAALWQLGRAWIRDEAGDEWPTLEEPPRLVARQNRRPVPVLLGPRGGGVDFELEIPAEAVFQADVGLVSVMSSVGVQQHVRRARMAVSVARDESPFETIESVQVRSGRHWRPIDVDLSAYAGQRVSLRMEVLPERDPFEPEALAWWGSPRIAQRAD